MLRSIIKVGLDPGDAFYVTIQNGEYVVLDGNRRLAALKVLRNPTLLKGAGIADATERRILKDIGDYILNKDYEVRAFPFTKREDAEGWIERRHGNSLDGEGRVNWDPKQIQRFRKDRSVLDVIDFVDSQKNCNLDWPAVRKSAEANTSTIKRFLVSKSGREFLGYRASDDKKIPTTTKDVSYLGDALLRIFTDIHSGAVSSRTHNKASEIKAYFHSMPDALKEKRETDYGPRTFASLASGPTASVAGRKTAAKAAVSANKIARVRDTLAPTKFSFNEPSTEKGKQLLREASQLRTGTFPLSCAYTFRTIIEYTLDTYMRNHNIPRHELKKDLETVLQHLKKNDPSLNSDLKGVRQTLTNGPMSIEALNGYVHNRFQLPSDSDLRNAWDHADALLLAVFGEKR